MYTIIKKVNKLKVEKEKLIKDKKTLEIEFDDYIESVEYEEIEEEEIEPSEPLINGTTTVNSTVEPTVDERLNPTVSNGSLKEQSTVENMSDEDLKKEMIRQAMSELGKRSAKKRAKKKTA